MNRSQSGFTLVELMIAVAVVGILAVIAYPSYVEQVRKSHRTDAKSTLTQIAQNLERQMSERGSYASATLKTDPKTDVYPSDTSEGGYYTLALNPKPTDTSFTVTATPTGSQADDSCGTYSLNDKGEKAVSKGTVSDCW